MIATGPGDDWSATSAALAGVETIVAWRWRAGATPPAVPAGVRLAPVAAAGLSAAANAGLAVASAPVVAFLRAGDRPPAGWAEAHLREHDAGAGIVAAATDPGLGAAWVGLRPAAAPAHAGRHLSAARPLLLELGGLDDRLHDLDVAGVELVARAAEAGARVSARDDLLVSGPLDTEAAGQSAVVLDALLDGRPELTVGPRRAALRLRWSGSDGPRARFARGRGLPALPTADLDRVGLPAPAPAERPAVTVIVPFAGSADAAKRLLAALRAIDLRPGDEIVVADNSREPSVPAGEGHRVVRATAEPSSYHARNAAAETATTDWLFFTDGDCRPAPWLLDAFFAEPVDERCGALAGAVLSAPHDGAWAERYAEWAGVLSQPRMLEHPYLPGAVTANLLVRRAAYDDAGGFCEDIRSGGDREFCWRLQDRGWTLGWRPHAAVEHHHRASMKGLLRQFARYGSGAGWLARRRGDTDEAWTRPSPRLLEAFVRDLATARPESAGMRAAWAACALAGAAGRLTSNRPRPPRPHPGDTVGLAAVWPPETPVAGPPASVEAARRAARPARTDPERPVVYAEDDAALDRLRALPRRGADAAVRHRIGDRRTVVLGD